MKKKTRVLVVCKYSPEEKESEACLLVNRPDLETSYSWKNTLKTKNISKKDVIIAVGGDGTALSAAHYNKNLPILIVNENPRKSEGALANTTLKQLPKKLEKIAKRKFKIEKLERIEVKINSKIIQPLALNEVFIASEKAYLMSRYKIKINKKISEEQKSSGIIFSTGTGSTAWFKSAGGKPFSPQSKYIKFIVREPYIRKLKKFKTIKHTIPENQTITIIPLQKMILSIDSIREFHLKEKDKIEIKISKHPLLRIC